jgi:hypothetical protein
MSCEVHKGVEETLQDHEDRLRELEKSNMKQEVQLMQIEKNQMELKSTLLEASKEQSKTINDFTDKILTALTNTVNKNNEIKFFERKEIWALVSAVVGGIITYIIK